MQKVDYEVSTLKNGKWLTKFFSSRHDAVAYYNTEKWLYNNFTNPSKGLLIKWVDDWPQKRLFEFGY